MELYSVCNCIEQRQVQIEIQHRMFGLVARVVFANASPRQMDTRFMVTFHGARVVELVSATQSNLFTQVHECVRYNFLTPDDVLRADAVVAIAVDGILGFIRVGFSRFERS